MSDALRQRLTELASEFTSSVMSAVRAASMEDLLAETGPTPRAPRRSAKRVAGARARRRASTGAFAAAERKLRAAMAHPHDPLQRYAVGEIIAAVKRDPDRYGDGAVPLLAAAVGEPIAGLYRFAKVAEAWSRAEVRRLLAQGVTWSHLVALVWHVEPARRASWLERIKREHLTCAISRFG